MKNILKIIYIFLCIVLLSGTSTFADESITIVRGQDYPPYHFQDENGAEQGFVIEIIKGTAHSMALPITFKQYPWSRCMNMMEKGQADAMMNLFKTKQRESFMVFADIQLGYETNSLFALVSSSIKYTGSLNSIAGYKIGIIRNYSYGQQFDAFNFPFLYPLENEKELINSLVNNRCNIIIGNKLTLGILLKRLTVESKIKALSPNISRDPLYIGFSKKKGHEELARQFSEKLEKFKTSESYREIVRKYSLETQ